MKSVQNRKKKTWFKRIEPVLYLAPAFIVLGIFVYYPFFKTIGESFFLLNSMGEVKEFIGFENYQNILTNKKFIQSILNSVKFAIFTVPFTVGLSFILAMMAAKKRPASPLYETLFSLPMAMSTSVAAMIFELMFSPTLGIINSLTGLNIKWLSDRDTAMWVLIVIQVWMNLGYNFLFILAAIRGMSKEVTESARLDGATSWKQAVYIVMPLISPTLFFLLCNSLAKMLMMSGLTLILTQGVALREVQKR